MAQYAEYETAVYFEDAAGNRDTIILGADTTANGIENLHLGMISIHNPWDSIFEVRVSSDNMYKQYFEGLIDSIIFYKKFIIDPVYVPSCGLVGNSIFFIHSLHHPVTITWDTLYWTQCFGDGAFLYNRDENLEPGWWTIPDFISYSCLGLVQNYFLDTTSHYNLSGIVDSVNNTRFRFIYGVRLQSVELQHPLSPCAFVVSSPDIALESFKLVQIFPNPAANSIHISLPEKIGGSTRLMIRITNNQGLLCYTETGWADQDYYIDLQNFNPGLFFLTVYEPEGIFIQTQKFVIIK
jgi:hypothetical protein